MPTDLSLSAFKATQDISERKLGKWTFLSLSMIHIKIDLKFTEKELKIKIRREKKRKAWKIYCHSYPHLRH
jgi:hypothetical protein